MIISKFNNFIFFKNMKVAGSSFEIYLSKFCSTEDIITPLNYKEEELRKKLGYKNKQNYKKNFIEQYINITFLKYLVKKIPLTKYIINYKTLPRLAERKFFHHMPATKLYSIIGDQIYRYNKIAILRNPISMFVSMYNHKLKIQNFDYIEFDEFIENYAEEFFNHQLKIISLNNKIIIDYFLIYERIEKSFKYLNKNIKLNLIYNDFKDINEKKFSNPKKLSVNYLKDYQKKKIMIYANEYYSVYLKAFKIIENEKN